MSLFNFIRKNNDDFSQSGQDQFAYNISGANGMYLEIGAHDPIINSNTFKKIANIFLKQGKLVITNPKKNKISFYNGSNIIIPNEKEFNKFFNSKTSLKNKVKIFFSSKFLEHLILICLFFDFED